MTRGAAESRDELLPPSEARRCSCGEPNTTGLCAYRVGQCPRETRDAAAVRQPVVSRRIGWGGVARCVYCGRRSAPHLLACYRHADLVALDIRYAGLFGRGKVPA